MRERIATLNQIDPYVGRYFSAEWVKKKVLMMTDEEIEDMRALNKLGVDSACFFTCR